MSEVPTHTEAYYDEIREAGSAAGDALKQDNLPVIDAARALEEQAADQGLTGQDANLFATEGRAALFGTEVTE